MRKKGFFITAISFFLFLILFSLFALQNEFIRQRNQIKTEIIGIEHARFERTILENNIDFLASKTLLETAEMTREPNQLRSEYTRRFFSRLKTIEQTYPTIRFYSGRVNPDQYAKPPQHLTALNSTELESLLVLWPIPASNPLKTTKLEFTGGRHQDTTVIATILGQENPTIFLIPIGYQLTVIQ
ncbi:MAG: hypothetical protein J4215_01125 [Candidatus Diapherotrites archaeon]|uniref:Uncharacterized protein n=1 Tax=Candidatus Iainarchaeum sp. TaxID=3101447 RepID=A0A8T4LE41_9ARCH|nr:hypothetical protein [Candidatus Diapherotrites archaeon]